jgi:integrase
MKLAGRHAVEGTEPTIYIGHRPYRDQRTGKARVSKTWYAEYCLEAKRHYEALGTSNKAAAVKQAHAIIHRIDRGSPSKPNRRVDIATLRRDYMQMLCDRERAPKTIEKYKYVLGEFEKWAKENDHRYASSLDVRSFWAFNRAMIASNLSEKTRYDRLIIIKQLMKWAHRARRIGANPFDGISIQKPEATEQPCFTPQQVVTLLDKADPRERIIFATMAYAGLRFGECRELRWSTVLCDRGRHGFIAVRRGGSSGKTKSKRVRHIPIHSELRELFDASTQMFDRVFTARPSDKHPDGGGPIDERRLLRSLKRLCRRCEFVNPDQYKLHTFRHAFASMCARNNISYKYALEWMGHKSSDILDLYYTMYDETAEAAMATIDYAGHRPNANTPAA